MPSEIALGLLEALGAYSDHLVWLAILAFLAGAGLEVVDRRRAAVPIAAAGWVLFGVFWLSMFPYFWIEFGSPLEGALSLAALPLSLYAAYLLLTGRDQLLVVSRAVACMGLLYLPVMTIEPVRVWLIETVAGQTQSVMHLLGYEVPLETGANGYESRFDFSAYTAPGDDYSTYIVLACTGIGSISIFGGLIASVRAPLRRKVVGFAAATGVIYVLNIARNVFVGIASPMRWFDTPTLEWLTVTLAGEGHRTSFFVSHHLIAQSLSVVALVAITLLVVRIVPEVMEPLEEVLYVLTNREIDLAAAIGEEHAPAADGEPDVTATDGGLTEAAGTADADATAARGSDASGPGTVDATDRAASDTVDRAGSDVADPGGSDVADDGDGL